ncbi:MAG: type II restriction endonuclease [bacterium]
MCDFEKWLSEFRNSISDYKYYVDFEKVYEKAEKIKIELNILNSLIGSKNIEAEFLNIIEKYPETLKCIPILIAVREKEIFTIDSDGEFTYSFKKMNYSKEQYAIFMSKTGLFDLLQNHVINNLFDYVTGVETGLNSNGRKNRGGHLMENLVEGYIIKSGYIKGDNYFKEMYLSDIQQKFNLDLGKISNTGKTKKRFDFVIYKNGIVYAIETNFYASSGSKLNETARSYKNITIESKDIKGFEFVWFTDGKGWSNAKNNLRETYDVLDMIYNINDLENGIINKLGKE